MFSWALARRCEIYYQIDEFSRLVSVLKVYEKLRILTVRLFTLSIYYHGNFTLQLVSAFHLRK